METIKRAVFGKSYIQLAKERANALGIEIFEEPKSSIKKFHTYHDGKKIAFGDRRFDDYLIHKNEARRELFHLRFKSSPFYNDKNSALYYAQKILW